MLETAQGSRGGSFLADSVQLSQSLLNDILSGINSIQTFELEQETLWNNQLADLTANISRFVEITTLLSKLIMAKNPKFLADVKDSHTHLLFIMKGLIQAQHKQDNLALEELIKYELKDNLTLWKIDLIPQTKRFLNT